LKTLVISELTPPLNITHVVDGSGLEKLSQFLERLKSRPNPLVCLDTETNIAVDFWFRRVRTIQVGDTNEQYVIDLLPFAGSEDDLVNSQANYGKNNSDLYKPIFDVLDPVLCQNTFLKVGQNLSYEYEVLNWNFGRRIWNLYSTDIAERVIRAGSIALKKYHEFSMEEIVKRYFDTQIDKTKQKTFDLSSPLTKEQLEYAALDVRMPIAMRQAQVNILITDQLLTTVQIENDAIGTYVDMHLVGQNMDDERWLKRVEAVRLKRIEEVKTLDVGFIPIVGKKTEVIDHTELARLEKIWKENFEATTPEEMAKAAQIREEKNPTKKDALKEELKALKLVRSAAKAKARAEFYAKRREASDKKKIIESVKEKLS
jgi:ribonuclease D